ncbi:MAG: hypothetical protein HY447_01200 [Candidatus Omnitrophica bacterium]|nr:hypothetical protein [Candidatus Omnitrophota bacterium]
MEKKAIAVAAAGFFTFILIITAWDHCPSDADTLLSKGNSALQSYKIKKPHYPCTSLKDAYDIFVSLRVPSGSNPHLFKEPTSDLTTASFEWNSPEFHGLSPPFENSRAQNPSIFLLYRNLRL